MSEGESTRPDRLAEIAKKARTAAELPHGRQWHLAYASDVTWLLGELDRVVKIVEGIVDCSSEVPDEVFKPWDDYMNERFVVAAGVLSGRHETMSDDEKIAKCVAHEWPDCVNVNCGFPCLGLGSQEGNANQ